eukprot:gb/GECH01012346.1/.p1 GENE.gb/GECH01012346.1/~~gb/GECH01012346.1/.p1  ORF type:complete len:289 (+),score=49.99 gb/GECH01012346.1/:1-867(+)
MKNSSFILKILISLILFSLFLEETLALENESHDQLETYNQEPIYNHLLDFFQKHVSINATKEKVVRVGFSEIPQYWKCNECGVGPTVKSNRRWQDPTTNTMGTTSGWFQNMLHEVKIPSTFPLIKCWQRAFRNFNSTKDPSKAWNFSLVPSQWQSLYDNATIVRNVTTTFQGQLHDGSMASYRWTADSLVRVDSYPSREWFNEGFLWNFRKAMLKGYHKTAEEEYFDKNQGEFNAITSGFLVASNIYTEKDIWKPNGDHYHSSSSPGTLDAPYVVAYVLSGLPQPAQC